MAAAIEMVSPTGTKRSIRDWDDEDDDTDRAGAEGWQSDPKVRTSSRSPRRICGQDPIAPRRIFNPR